ALRHDAAVRLAPALHVHLREGRRVLDHGATDNGPAAPPDLSTLGPPRSGASECAYRMLERRAFTPARPSTNVACSVPSLSAWIWKKSSRFLAFPHAEPRMQTGPYCTSCALMLDSRQTGASAVASLV